MATSGAARGRSVAIVMLALSAFASGCGTKGGDAVLDPGASDGSGSMGSSDDATAGDASSGSGGAIRGDDTGPGSTGSSTNTSTETGGGTFGMSPLGEPCEEGAKGCSCIGKGECQEGLRCFNAICLDFEAPCPFTNTGVCDEPSLCPKGTDVDDCCAALENGVCEERSRGGACPDGTDDYDCGRCRRERDGWCDVPGSCPAGTDVHDCCARPKDGHCDEEGGGGRCWVGSDDYDCGRCPKALQDDGVCDEPKGSGLCPPNSDPECRATEKNGVCEDREFGGQYGRWSDLYDCGYCRPDAPDPHPCP